MSEQQQLEESLSALMDGEAGELEVERVLERSGDKEIRSAWMRYHAIRSAMGEGRPQRLGADISARVMKALEAEPPVRIQPVARWRNFLKPAAGLAVAASVFASVLIGVQFYGSSAAGVNAPGVQPTVGVPAVGLVNGPGAAVRAGYETPALPTFTTSARDNYDRLARERLHRYMLAHAEEAALNAPQGLMPYARVASFRMEEE